MRLLIVSHRALDQAGGTVARWRGMVPHLEALGWEVDVVAAPVRTSAQEFVSDPKDLRWVKLRARVMAPLGKLIAPLLWLVGARAEAMPVANLWMFRGSRDVRRALKAKQYDVVLATSPPHVALVAARLGTKGADAPPFVAEQRDLWADNPAFEAWPGILRLAERWVHKGAAAVVAVTPQAVESLRQRYPAMADRVYEVSNGFDPEVYELRRPPRALEGKITLIHSGSLTFWRPLLPLLEVLARDPYRLRFRLRIQGFVGPENDRAIAAFKDRVEIEVIPAAPWREAVETVANADVAVIVQADRAGDNTAVAGKLYEYLALGKPVLCVSHGGGCESVLRSVGADRFCAEMDDPGSIAAALDALLADPSPQPVESSTIDRFNREVLSERMSELLKAVAAGQPANALRASSSTETDSRTSATRSDERPSQ